MGFNSVFKGLNLGSSKYKVGVFNHSTVAFSKFHCKNKPKWKMTDVKKTLQLLFLITA
jgi:hypothetical protein